MQNFSSLELNRFLWCYLQKAWPSDSNRKHNSKLKKQKQFPMLDSLLKVL